MTDLKNTLTNILGIVLVVGGAMNSYLESTSGDINWVTLGVAIVTALIAYFTGKQNNGKKKVL